MRKIGFGIFAVAFAIMLSGCGAPLNATLSVENNTDKEFVYMISYNYNWFYAESPKELKANSTETEVLSCDLGHASYKEVKFFYMEKSIYNEACANHDTWNASYILTNSSLHKMLLLEDATAKEYNIVFSPKNDGSDNYTVEFTAR